MTNERRHRTPGMQRLEGMLIGLLDILVHSDVLRSTVLDYERIVRSFSCNRLRTLRKCSICSVKEMENTITSSR